MNPICNFHICYPAETKNLHTCFKFFKITLGYSAQFIYINRISCGVRILAITLAFQAREAGSIPARRSNFPVWWTLDHYYQYVCGRTLFFDRQIKSYNTVNYPILSEADYQFKLSKLISNRFLLHFKIVNSALSACSYIGENIFNNAYGRGLLFNI